MLHNPRGEFGFLSNRQVRVSVSKSIFGHCLRGEATVNNRAPFSCMELTSTKIYKVDTTKIKDDYLELIYADLLD